MLCVTLKSYTRACGSTTGGVSSIFVFDPSDFDWTQTAPGDPYTAVARREGATFVGEAKMFPIKFQAKEAEFKFKQSVTGCSVKYEFEIGCQLPDLSNDLTAFLMSMDSAGCCCGLGLVIELNSGKVFVVGEKYVNDARVPFFEVKMDGTEGTSGKKYEDFNGANVVFKGDYKRAPFEFTGGIDVIAGFETA